MYDDLERSQRPSHLEWLVVNVVIPSVLVTFALHARPDPAGLVVSAPEGPICVLGVIGVDHPLIDDGALDAADHLGAGRPAAQSDRGRQHIDQREMREPRDHGGVDEGVLLRVGPAPARSVRAR